MVSSAEQHLSLVQRTTRWVRSITLGEWLFYAAFLLSAFASLVMRTTFDSVFGLPKGPTVQACYAAGALLLIAKILVRPARSWRFPLSIALAVLCFVVYQTSGIWRVAMLFLFIAAGEGVSIRRLAGLVLALGASMLAVTIWFAFGHDIYSFTVWRMEEGEWAPRYSYGFAHPNTLGAVLLAVACAFAALRFPRFHVGDALVYVAAAVIVAVLVESRTATACIVLVGVLAAAAKAVAGNAHRQRGMAVVSLLIFVGLGGLSLFMMVAYDANSTWMATLDQAISTRFSLAHRFFEVFPPRAFGRELMAVKLDTLVQEAPDNAYARMVIKHGIVPAVVLGVLLLATYIHAVRNAEWNVGMLGLTVYAVAAVMERYALDPTVDFFLVMCALAVLGGEVSHGKQGALGGAAPGNKQAMLDEAAPGNAGVRGKHARGAHAGTPVQGRN